MCGLTFLLDPPWLRQRTWISGAGVILPCSCSGVTRYSLSEKYRDERLKWLPTLQQALFGAFPLTVLQVSHLRMISVADLAGFWHWQLLAEIRGLCGGESEGSSNDCGSWGWWFPFLLEQKSGVLGERTRKELQSYMNWNSPEWCNDFTLDITITHLLVLGCLSHACNV